MIKIGDASFTEKDFSIGEVLNKNAVRDCIMIQLTDTTSDDIEKAFVDNAPIVRVVTDVDGVVHSTDYSAYNMAGDIINKRDGTFVVYMCKKTKQEITDERIAELELENAQLLYENLTGEEYSV